MLLCHAVSNSGEKRGKSLGGVEGCSDGRVSCELFVRFIEREMMSETSLLLEAQWRMMSY